MRRRPNFAQTRERLDGIAWKIIDDRVPSTSDHIGLACSAQPANYAELEQAVRGGQDYEDAFDGFLRQMYFFKRVSLFEYPPSNFFPARERAFLAAVAEYFSLRFRLPVPPWVHEPEYTLTEEWDWILDWEYCPAEFYEPEFAARRRAKADPVFLKHGINYEVRNLIRV
jgi:hypothetical protein